MELFCWQHAGKKGVMNCCSAESGGWVFAPHRTAGAESGGAGRVGRATVKNLLWKFKIMSFLGGGGVYEASTYLILAAISCAYGSVLRGRPTARCGCDRNAPARGCGMFA